MNSYNNGDKVYTVGDIDRLERENAELKAQLIEVNNNRTGVSPCAKFCEALAAKKMFDNLQQENAELKVQVDRLEKELISVKIK